jgi:rod shape determining protein RodA
VKAVSGYLRRTDRTYLAMCFGCSVFACIVLVSIGMEQLGGFTYNSVTGQVSGLGGYRSALMQAAASLVGLAAAVLLSRIDYHNLVDVWPFHVAVTWGLVLPTLVLRDFSLFGDKFVIGYAAPGSDNYSWYKIGAITFQPAELAKISFIMTFAMHLDKVRGRVNEPRELLKLLAHLLAPALLIHVQGDDGTMLIFLFIGLCMLFSAGLDWRYVLGALAAGISAVAVAFGFFSEKIGKSYQWIRILAVLDPENTSGWALDAATYNQYTYQQQRGEISLGAGQIFGRGLFSGSYVYIPNAWNDFILSWIGNAVGFVGTMLVLGVLFGVVIRTFATAMRSEDPLGSYICVGVGGAMLAQIIVNVGMNLRILPVIGVTLPFYSAGGSSVLMLYLCVGLVLSVYMHNKKSLFSAD